MGPPSGLRSSWTPKPNAFFGFLPVLRPRRGCLPRRGPLPFFKKFSVRPIFFPRFPVILGGTRDSTAQKGGKNHGPRCRPDPPDEPGGRRGHRGLRPKVLPPDPGVLLLPSPPPRRPSPGSSPPWTGTATMARRPTTSTSSPATSAGTTSAAGRSSPWRTCPRRRPRPPTGTPAWTWKPPSGPCRRRSRPWPSSACSRSASSGRPPRSWASACPW